jgi:hypothetical protein
VRVLHRAERWLGDEHNVAVLCEELSRTGSVCDGLIDLDRLRPSADRYQCALRNKALASARPIYARTAASYVRAIRRDWKKWCQALSKNV